MSERVDDSMAWAQIANLRAELRARAIEHAWQLRRRRNRLLAWVARNKFYVDGDPRQARVDATALEAELRRNR